MLITSTPFVNLTPGRTLGKWFHVSAGAISHVLDAKRTWLERIHATPATGERQFGMANSPLLFAVAGGDVNG